MRIAVAASEEHYAAHVRPIVHELEARGVDVDWLGPSDCFSETPIPTVVASMSDAAAVPHARPLCLVDHGIGQVYRDCDHQSYNGGRNRERVSLFLYGATCGIEANQARYPDATHVLCGPARLDKWADYQRARVSLPLPGEWGWVRATVEKAVTGFVQSKPVVGLAWHWPLSITPETMWAWPYYQSVIERLIADGSYMFLGHAHPRAWPHIEGHYQAMGIEMVRDADELFGRCDLLAVDNSSILYEAAATGLPVLALDAPHYRDQPRQPPRFYEDVPGLRLRAYRDQAPECGMVQGGWGRDHLGDAIEEALEDRASLQGWRAHVVHKVYGDCLDGKSAARAADAIEAWARG